MSKDVAELNAEARQQPRTGQGLEPRMVLGSAEAQELWGEKSREMGLGNKAKRKIVVPQQTD
ncbi:MAG: hypothetical protein JW749_11150 [Sedimentisphaerales bacterium]|nr:hypothetical protein [Sedimentisphaerales bacterium]